MVFVKTITTAASTSQISPLESFIGIARGLLYRMQVMFPRGCVGLAGLKLFDGSHQILPVSRDEWIIGSDETIDFEDMYWVKVLNTRFRILTYNEDTAYQHKIYLRIGIVGQPEFIAHFLPTVGYDQLEKIMSDLTDDRINQELSDALAAVNQIPTEGEENG